MKISLAIFTGFALLALVSADLIMSVPDHCVLVTFNNTCLGCEPGYDLNNQTNTCTFKNVTAPIAISATTTSQSTAAVIDNKFVLPQKLDLSNANVPTLLTNLDSQITSTSSSTSSPSNSSNSSSPQNNIVILSSVIKTVSSSSSANSESLATSDTTNTTINNGTSNNGTSNNATSNNATSNNATSSLSSSNNTSSAAAQNSSSTVKTSTTTLTIITDTKSASTIASTVSNSSGTVNSNSGSSSTVQFSSGFSIKSVDDLNCKIKANDSTCSVCYDSYYYSTNDKLCVPVSPTCKTWNRLGECLTCYDGYELSQTTCTITSVVKVVQYTTTTQDPNCFQFSGNVCKKCAFRFYFKKQKICTTVAPDCKTWDQNNGSCLSCFDGFTLKDSICQLVVVITASTTQNKAITTTATFVDIPNCSQYNDKNQCVKCAFRYYPNAGKCSQVSDLCKSWSISDGQCTSCYFGYDINNGKCQIIDPFCTIKSADGCVQCLNRYFLDVNLKCKIVDPLCKAYDPLTGACTDCFDGYTLSKQSCIVAR